MTSAPNDSRRPAPRFRRFAWLVLAAGALLPSPALAQAGSEGPSPKRATAVRAPGPIVVDGRLDDAAWAAAVPISDLLQREPVLFAEPTDRTEFRILYDDRELYIGARMQVSDFDQLPRDVTRRDQYGNSEHVVISLDPYLDRRTAYSFSVTAGGVRRDYYHATDSDDFMIRDFTWDPVWDGRSTVDSLGWTAEFRIPFSQLRFNDAPEQVWGLNLYRWSPQRNEGVWWVVVPRDQTGYASRFGTLTGITRIPPARRLELIPYAAANADFVTVPVSGDPFTDGSETGARTGADLRMGLGPSLTLNATVNPDFGQVEADPAELNLTAFETFFPERRPFFTEGRQLIEGPVPNYFYSRRIGARPRGSVSAERTAIPDNTTILGAAKVSGRTASGLSIGVLAAATQREEARTWNAGSYGTADVEPAALFGVTRVTQQFGASGSVIGFSLSGMRRAFPDGSPLRQQLSRGALAGGVDWALRLQGGAYQIGGHIGGSWVGGDSIAILRIQRNPAHYFQRPDRASVRLDSTRTHLIGMTASLGAAKFAGNWLWAVETRLESPEFETNDMGRLQKSDDLEAAVRLELRETDPGPVFRRWQVGAGANGTWNWDGDRTQNRIAGWVTGTWNNYVDTRLTVYHQPRRLSDTQTRGGPLMAEGRVSGFELGANSNFSNPSGWRVNFEYATSEVGHRYRQLGTGFRWRPSTRIGLSVDPSWFHYLDARQYFTTLNGGPPATFGRRYVFAAIDQTILRVQFRGAYTLNPDLTLEVFAEPFTASGRYQNHAELPAPRALELRTYGTDGTTVTEGDRYLTVADARTATEFQLPVADFTTFSFRSNVVLRWEWRRGSTLYLVWQQNRAGRCSAFDEPARCPTATIPGSISRPGFLGDAFGVPGDNYLAIKISYWLPVG